MQNEIGKTKPKKSNSIALIIIISVLTLIIIALSILCISLHDKISLLNNQYYETTIKINIDDVEQKTYKNEDTYIISFLDNAGGANNFIITVSIYDKNNQIITNEIIKTGDGRIDFNKYGLPLIFSIDIDLNKYPTMKYAKITEFKVVVYNSK